MITDATAMPREIVEIKSSVEDFRADQIWSDYRMHCDREFFAAPPACRSTSFPWKTV
jgi:hypothetical protein